MGNGNVYEPVSRLESQLAKNKDQLARLRVMRKNAVGGIKLLRTVIALLSVVAVVCLIPVLVHIDPPLLRPGVLDWGGVVFVFASAIVAMLSWKYLILRNQAGEIEVYIERNEAAIHDAEFVLRIDNGPNEGGKGWANG